MESKKLSKRGCETLAAGKCPNCGKKSVKLGPQGGLAQNIFCEACNARYNMTPFGVDIIEEPTPRKQDPPTVILKRVRELVDKLHVECASHHQLDDKEHCCVLGQIQHALMPDITIARPCPYDEPWVGKCKKPGHPYCKKHAKKKCCVCGAQATRGCSHAVSLVCGMPLCDKCVCPSHPRG